MYVYVMYVYCTSSLAHEEVRDYRFCTHVCICTVHVLHCTISLVPCCEITGSVHMDCTVLCIYHVVVVHMDCIGLMDYLVPGSSPGLTGMDLHTVWGKSRQSSSVTQVSSKWRPGMSQFTPNEAAVAGNENRV